MRQYNYIVALFLLFLMGCNSDEDEVSTGPPALTPLMSNGGSISGTFIDTNGVSSPWSADLVRIARSNAFIQLETNAYVSGQKLKIQFEATESGSYMRQNGENEGPGGFFRIGRDFPEGTYYSVGSRQSTSAELTIVFDSINKTANGSFDMTFDIDDDLPVWQLTQGVFTDVPYDFNLLAINGEVKVEVDGEARDLNSNLGFVSDGQIFLDFSDLSTLENFFIALPDDITAGAFSFPGSNFDGVYFKYTDYSGAEIEEFVGENIMLNVLYHNVENRSIAVEYSFDSPESFGNPIRTIRNGYFELVYNDWL